MSTASSREYRFAYRASVLPSKSIFVFLSLSTGTPKICRYPFLNVQYEQTLARLQSIKQEIGTSEEEIKLYCFGSEEQVCYRIVHVWIITSTCASSRFDCWHEYHVPMAYVDVSRIAGLHPILGEPGKKKTTKGSNRAPGFRCGGASTSIVRPLC